MAGTPIKANGDFLFPNEFNKNAQGLQNLINATGISLDINNWEQLQDALNYYILQGAVYEDISTTANKITLTKSAGTLAGLKMPSSYIEGFYVFFAGTTNTGSTVLNLNNIGNKTVKKITRDNTTKANLTGGEFIAGLKYVVYYDGTDIVYFDIFDNIAKDDEVIKKDGTVAFTGSQSMGNNNLTNVEDIYLNDKLYHNGDTDTYVGFLSNTQDFYTGGTRRLRINSSGLQLQNGTAINEFSIDGNLSGNSDNAVPTEKAVKTFVNNNLPSTPISGAGYTYTSSDWLIQKGVFAVANNSSGTVNLPEAFSNTNYSIVLTEYSNDNGSDSYVNGCKIKTKSTGSFTYYNETGGNRSVLFIAIGE